MEPDGVTAVSQGNPEFEGENTAYILDRDGVAVVDPGIPEPTVREKLVGALAERGHDLGDVDTVLLTHFHIDHIGLAAEIQSAGDASVHVHRDDAPIVRGDADALESMRTRQRERFDRWGVPDRKRAAIPGFESHDEAEPVSPVPESVTPLEDGETVSAGGFDMRVIHTPGHAAGHACFEFATGDGREAFVGDTILPVYTPNVGGSDTRLDDPLSRYLESLRRLDDREYPRVWPGHRSVIEDPDGRIREIVDHHRERCRRIVSILEDHGPADAWTVSDHLFGELDGIHIVHGPGEAYAHLEYLRNDGVVELTATGYGLRTRADAVSWDSVV